MDFIQLISYLPIYQDWKKCLKCFHYCSTFHIKLSFAKHCSILLFCRKLAAFINLLTSL